VVQKLIRGNIQTEHTQDGDLISLFPFLESRLEMELLTLHIHEVFMFIKVGLEDYTVILKHFTNKQE
jgi:hypothetical protein